MSCNIFDSLHVHLSISGTFNKSSFDVRVGDMVIIEDGGQFHHATIKTIESKEVATVVFRDDLSETVRKFSSDKMTSIQHE
jgi:hypothetical protein